MSQESASPIEAQLSQCFGHKNIRTFVFIKTKTTGVYTGPEPFKNFEALKQNASPDVYQEELLRYMNKCDLSQLPRLTALALLSVPRGAFVNSMESMQNDFVNEKPSLETHTPGNILHVVLNHEVSEEESMQSQQSQKSSPLRYSQNQNRRLGCHLNQTFGEQWPVIFTFLSTLPKPVCLVAHYGIYFDFPVFLGEIKRAGIRELPEGLLFADSYFAAKNMETTFKAGVFNQLLYFGGTRPNDHPWQLMKRGRIPPAFLKRFPEEEFHLNNGQWQCLTDLNAAGRYRLVKLYSQIFGKNIDKIDFALPASEAILQVCLAFGSNFLGYADASATELPRPT